jgi:hypothetical protein
MNRLLEMERLAEAAGIQRDKEVNSEPVVTAVEALAKAGCDSDQICTLFLNAAALFAMSPKRRDSGEEPCPYELRREFLLLACEVWERTVGQTELLEALGEQELLGRNVAKGGVA